MFAGLQSEKEFGVTLVRSQVTIFTGTVCFRDLAKLNLPMVVRF